MSHISALRVIGFLTTVEVTLDQTFPAGFASTMVVATPDLVRDVVLLLTDLSGLTLIEGRTIEIA